MRRLLCPVLAITMTDASANPPEAPATLRAMKDELARSIESLALPDSAKPYFLSYQLHDVQQVNAEASQGALMKSGSDRTRMLDIDLRVGDYSFDNSNASEPEGMHERTRWPTIALPVEDNYDAVRHELWRATDSLYKGALESLDRKRAVAKSEAKTSDDVASFSKEPPSHIADDRVVALPEKTRVVALAKKVSAVFRDNPDVYEGSVSIKASTERHYFVSSEGSSSVQTISEVTIEIACETQADDGMAIHDNARFSAVSFDQLPSETALLAQAAKLSAELSAIRRAPVVDDYTGPVLFEGIAADQLIVALLAESLSGTPAPKSDRPGARTQSETSLAGKVGQRILPAGVSIVDDPTVDHAGSALLVAGARFDAEGIPRQKVSLVEDGVFKRFLMSRTPRKGFEHSNGHATSTPFSAPRARPANVLVSSTKGVSDAEIKRRALATAKELGLPYVLVADKLDTHTVSMDDFDPSMFSTDALPRPSVARRLYLDGHDELVRGATFGALPIRALKDLLAVGKAATVYSYQDSGFGSRFAGFGVPSGPYVSIMSPALLVRDLDVKKPVGAHRAPPITPRPK